MTTEPPLFGILYSTVSSVQFQCTIFSTQENMADIKLEKSYFKFKKIHSDVPAIWKQYKFNS